MFPAFEPQGLTMPPKVWMVPQEAGQQIIVAMSIDLSVLDKQNGIRIIDNHLISLISFITNFNKITSLSDVNKFEEELNYFWKDK
jgi:hypothetical protein